MLVGVYVRGMRCRQRKQTKSDDVMITKVGKRGERCGEIVSWAVMTIYGRRPYAESGQSSQRARMVVAREGAGKQGIRARSGHPGWLVGWLLPAYHLTTYLCYGGARANRKKAARPVWQRQGPGLGGSRACCGWSEWPTWAGLGSMN